MSKLLAWLRRTPADYRRAPGLSLLGRVLCVHVANATIERTR